MITEYNQMELQKKWLEYSATHSPVIFYGVPTRVIHYEYLTIGPAGFLFSLYYREKEVLGGHEPLLAILAATTRTGADIVDWEKTDAFKVFLTVLKELDKKLAEISSTCPLYKNYLNAIGFEFSFSEWKGKLREFVKLFKNHLKQDKIPVAFYHLVQVTAMFFTDEEVVDMLNRLIAENALVINSETEIEDLKVTKEGIIKKPKSWLARPAFDLASDISSVSSYAQREFKEVLTEILRKGAIKYLEEVFDNDFGTFRQICARRCLHRLASLDKHLVPKEKAIRLVLESYGLQAPSTLDLDLRREIHSFLKTLEKFECEYQELSDRKLTRRIIELLREGRTHLERILKELLFVMISFILFYEETASREPVEEALITDRPIFYIGYDPREGD